MADHESSSNYKQARSMGKRYVSDHGDNAFKGYLPVLDDLTRDVEIAGELNLGSREIPINKVVGTRTTTRSNAFAGNFMPLLAENTEFGTKWRKLYNSHIEEGIREPVKVFEYINRYFVQEGNKRVSVLKYLNAVTVYASVTRLIPRRDESNETISIYYEFLDFDRREVFDNLWFSRRGGFTRVIQIVEAWQEAHPDARESTADLLRTDYKAFRQCYKEDKENFSSLPITTGDAYLEFLNIYGFDPKRTLSEIRDRVKSCAAQFRLISVRGIDTVNNVEMKTSESKSPLSFFSRRPRKLKVAFAFEGQPGVSLWTTAHEVACRRLERSMGDKVSVITRYHVPGGDETYDCLREMMDEEPDILFATSPNMSAGTLRLSLEHPDTAILNCDRPQPRKNMMTYFPKTYEAAYLCGILAGSQTRTGTIGYLTPARFHRNLAYNVNAFALGAKMVNPTVRVVNYLMARPNATDADHIRARYALARRGVDIAMCPHQLNTPLVRKAFPGVYAQLYILNQRTGHPTECIGAAAYDFSVFYTQMINDSFTTKNSILDITRSGGDSSVHFGWGLNTGIVDVLGVDAFMGHNSIRLMGIFRDLIVEGRIHPFEGPLVDNERNTRLEKSDTMGLLDIYGHQWYMENIIEVIHAEDTDQYT